MGSLADEVRSRPRLPAPEVRRAIRQRADVSQDRMARELGVDRVTLLRWEQGTRSPRGAQLAAYAALLSDLDAAACDAGEPAEPSTIDELPGWAQKLIRDLRADAAGNRVRAKRRGSQLAGAAA